MLLPGNCPMRTSNANSMSPNLLTDSSGTEDDDLLMPRYQSSGNQVDNNSANQDELTPQFEGLRPRCLRGLAREQLNLKSDDEQDTSKEKGSKNEPEDLNDVEDNGADDGEDEGEDGKEEGYDEEGEEWEGRRRYDLRNHPGSPGSLLRRINRGQDVLVEYFVKEWEPRLTGMEKKGGSRVCLRHRLAQAEDSDDSLLVDDLDQGPPVPWGRGSSRSGPSWLLGGSVIDRTTSWSLKAAAFGWAHQNDTLANLTSGIQTPGPSSKGRADI